MIHILLIDDDQDLRTMLSMLLSRENYQVTQVAGVDTGLQALTKHKDIQLVITDIMMPDKTGVEGIPEILKKMPNIKILAISGGGRTLDKGFSLQSARLVGAHALLEKPFSKEQLLSTIKKLLNT